MNVIEVNNVSKMFRLGAHTGDLRDRVNALFAREQAAADRKAQEFWALQDISFSVAEGESFGIIGHNGSGKSTLLKLITGIYKPTTGTFRTHGRIAALIEVGAGFHPDLTGRENVYLNGSVLGMSRREIDKKFDEIVAFAELEKFMDTPVKRYSSGMYMRLGFAIAANINPDVVLVDEVLAVGDESFQKKCMDKMMELRREGKTIVFISHNMDAMATLCQKVMLLSHGHMLALGEPSDVISTYRTSVAMEKLERKNGADVVVDAQRELKRDMEIVEVSLLDRYGQPCDTIKLGDPITVACRYRANRRIEEPAFGVSLYRADEVYIYGFNTKYDGVAVHPADGDGEFRVTFDALNLLQGVYYFNVGLCLAEDTHNAIDWRIRAAVINVHASTLNQGLVSLAHTWELPVEAERYTYNDVLGDTAGDSLVSLTN